jgi:uncharacterized Ntn-hydrolase superfamily protein
VKPIALILLLAYTAPLLAQDTFSIIAIDSITGEIGSAGASCIGGVNGEKGVLIINAIIPGKGAINTQANYHPNNQENAKLKMMHGLSPSEIITWLKNNDVGNRIEQRQYGIADIDAKGKVRVAAFTGVSCNAYKSHSIGNNYCIQGNILAGQFVLDSMENAFNRTRGKLEDKLMAALMAAKIPGADTRCLIDGVSSKSAFIRVAKPKDKEGAYYLELYVSNCLQGQDPIDVLKENYNRWKQNNSNE